MTIHLRTQTDLDDALATLLKLDPRLVPIMKITGTPALRQRAPGFAGLATIVCGQQLSTSAAAAIWGRISAAFDPFDPHAILKARTDRLGRLGLSAAKIKSLKFIARELADERLNLDVLAEQDADASHHALTQLPGIGPWTADIYLLFCLGHGDAWPAGDLAIQEAMRIGLGLAARPTVKQMGPLAEIWRPVRGAAAHLWWSYYRVLKKREGVISDQATDAKGASSKRKPPVQRKPPVKTKPAKARGTKTRATKTRSTPAS